MLHRNHTDQVSQRFLQVFTGQYNSEIFHFQDLRQRQSINHGTLGFGGCGLGLGSQQARGEETAASDTCTNGTMGGSE